MPSVQLPNWEQIECRGEQSHPRRARNRMQVDVGGGGAREDHPLKHPENAGRAEREVPTLGYPGENLRICKTDGESRDDKYESGDWPGDTDIEELPSSVDRRPDSNKRTERSDQCRRRQKVRQAGIDPVVEAREIVSHLMCEQNG